MTKTELFLQLAQPDQNGCSRWINTTEFVGEYADLKFGNGASWARKESTLAKKYKIEFYLTIKSAKEVCAKMYAKPLLYGPGDAIKLRML